MLSYGSSLVNILIDTYDYSTVVSRNLPFSNHDLAQLVLLVRQATKCLYSVLPGNELVLLPLPSRNQSPSGPQISLLHQFESWCCCFEDHHEHNSSIRAFQWCHKQPLAIEYDPRLSHWTWEIRVMFAKCMGQGTPWHTQLVHLPILHSHTAWELTHYLPYACGRPVNRNEGRAWQGLEGREWKETTEWQEIVAGTHRWAWTQTSESPLRLLVRVMCMIRRCEESKVQMRFYKVHSRACKQHCISGRGRNAFPLCPHRRKDEIPLASAPNSLATSPWRVRVWSASMKTGWPSGSTTGL